MGPNEVFQGARNHLVDYIIIFAILVGYISIGCYHKLARKVTTMKEYVYGGKKIPVLSIAISIAFTFYGSLSIERVTSSSYSNGLEMLYQVLGCAIGIGVALYVFCPVIYKTNCRTIFEYLEKRFGTVTRKLGCLHLILCLVLLCSATMNEAGDTTGELSVISQFSSVVILIVVAVLYLFTGGVKAIFWISTIQGMLLCSAVTILLAKALVDLGLTKIQETLVKGGLTESIKFNFYLTENNFWSIIVHQIMYYSYIYGISPVHRQLAMCCNNFKEFRRSLLLAGIFDMIVKTNIIIIGIIMYASLGTCDETPNASNIATEESLIVFFTRKHCYTYDGMTGLVYFGMHATSITTVANVLITLSFLGLEDIVLPMFRNENLSDERQLLMIKFLINFFAGTMFFCTFSVASIKAFQIFVSVMIQGFFSTQSALFTLGVLFPRVNEKGVLIAALFGNVFVIWIGLGKILSFHSERTKLVCAEPNITTNNTSFAIYEMFYHSDWLHNSTVSVYDVGYQQIRNDSWKNVTVQEQEEQEYIFPLFRLTEQWINSISFLLMILAAYYISVITGEKQEVPPELLSPLTRFWAGNKPSNRRAASSQKRLSSRLRKYRSIKRSSTTSMKLSTRRRTQSSR